MCSGHQGRTQLEAREATLVMGVEADCEALGEEVGGADEAAQLLARVCRERPAASHS